MADEGLGRKAEGGLVLRRTLVRLPLILGGVGLGPMAVGAGDALRLRRVDRALRPFVRAGERIAGGELDLAFLDRLLRQHVVAPVVDDVVRLFRQRHDVLGIGREDAVDLQRAEPVRFRRVLGQHGVVALDAGIEIAGGQEPQFRLRRGGGRGLRFGRLNARRRRPGRGGGDGRSRTRCCRCRRFRRRRDWFRCLRCGRDRSWSLRRGCDRFGRR